MKIRIRVVKVNLSLLNLWSIRHEIEWISNNALDGVTNYAVSRTILVFVCDLNHDI